MDDPLWTWPAWKFGMKQEDLFTKLHDQYNTYATPIKDSEAFYCDIAEISYEAQSTAEFHHLANHRRQQRLSELNKSLESARLEIIGNPKLIKMPRWEHAVRLFQTNSLDSLVRYFASYLPIDHIWHPLCQDSALAATHDFPTSPLPKIRCKRSKANEAVSSYINHGVAVLTSGDGMSTMSDFNTFTRAQYKIKNTLNETVRLDKRLSTKITLKQVDLASKHSGGQRVRCVDSQVSAFPETLTSSPPDLSLPVSLQIPVASDGIIQVSAGVAVGLKRKR